jgi:hypothetical protein
MRHPRWIVEDRQIEHASLFAVGSGTLLRASLISVIDRSLIDRATASWVRPPDAQRHVLEVDRARAMQPQACLGLEDAARPSARRASRGMSPAMTAATIAADAAAGSGESRMMSMPAFTRAPRPSPAVAILVIAAIFIESEMISRRIRGAAAC